MRFRLGRPQTIGGWESLMVTLLTGVCRAALAWTENTKQSDVLDVAFGTHQALQVWQGGTLADITPFGPPALLAADPLTVANGSAVVVVHETAHGRTGGAPVLVAGATALGGITPNGGPFALTVVDVDNWSFVFTAPATSDADGGGSKVVVTPQTALPAGAANGTGSSGFGTGAFGVGAFGSPSTADYFPRTWSLQAWGQKLVASPRNGGLYLWSNDLAQRAVAIATAPTRITQMLVSTKRQIFALGCTQENGIYNSLCVRHCSEGDETDWLTNSSSASTAREYILPGGGRIVGGAFAGNALLVWTTHALFLGTYVGQVSQVWRFDRVGTRCGLVGPNAAAVLDSTAYWMGPDRQFHSYTPGGLVTPLACPIRKDFKDNLTASQADKICASTIAEFGEVRWDYPDRRDGLENSRYLVLAVAGADAGSWYRGAPLLGVTPARTAMFDAGPATYPIGVTADGHAYWHEKGNSADGGQLAWSIQSADLYLDPNFAALLREIWPDIGPGQVGPVNYEIVGRMFPQDTEVVEVTGALAVGQGVDDFKASARIFRLRFWGNSAPAYARIGRPELDTKPRGRRG